MEFKILTILYLLSSLAFIIGLKMLSHPETARTGNFIAAGGMALAIFGTIFLYENISNHIWIFAGLVVGSIVGTVAARKVKMTAMPQMVSLFNGMGGACAAVISFVEYQKHVFTFGDNVHVAIMMAGLVIGSVSFSGSMIAFGKLNGNIGDRIFPAQKFVNVLVLVIAVSTGVYVSIHGKYTSLVYLAGLVALLYGVMFVMPIGGADMPVVISLLNSFTGVAAAFGGFLYNNQVMLTGGILVGSAGTILTILMCRAMNRSLFNVIAGAFGASQAGSASGSGGVVKEISVSDASVLLAYSKKVFIIPGYGLAVAQAQHVCNELEKLLEERGVEVKYAIHPVAGRMPGHMNVLLAEADVPYEKLIEMEDANSQMSSTDVCVIIGANDVVNPAARSDVSSPIYGMPILDADKSKNVIVIKRSMGAGYAGIENELFFYPQTRMLFGDAKSVLQKLVNEIKTI